MSTSCTPTFANPPIVEFVLGAQFSPLFQLTTGHFGLFWKECGEDWIEPADGPALEDQFEIFEPVKTNPPARLQLRLEPVRLPGRFLLGHRSQDRLIQIQASRFHLNWQKQGQFYPSYKSLIREFEDYFFRFQKFVEAHELGVFAINQWEITYINSFPQGEYWQSPSDWANILPGLFGRIVPKEQLGIDLEHRGAECTYEITPKMGRLHVAAQPGHWGNDKRESLLLQMTARGPVGKSGVSTLREGLELGHRVLVDAFLRFVDPEVQKPWGIKQ